MILTIPRELVGIVCNSLHVRDAVPLGQTNKQLQHDRNMTLDLLSQNLSQ